MGGVASNVLGLGRWYFSPNHWSNCTHHATVSPAVHRVPWFCSDLAVARLPSCAHQRGLEQISEATKRNIHMVYISCGHTDTLQPLDVAVTRAFKSRLQATCPEACQAFDQLMLVSADGEYLHFKIGKIEKGSYRK